MNHLEAERITASAMMVAYRSPRQSSLTLRRIARRLLSDVPLGTLQSFCDLYHAQCMSGHTDVTQCIGVLCTAIESVLLDSGLADHATDEPMECCCTHHADTPICVTLPVGFA